MCPKSSKELMNSAVRDVLGVSKSTGEGVDDVQLSVSEGSNLMLCCNGTRLGGIDQDGLDIFSR